VSVSSDVGPLDPAVVTALYKDYAQELLAFLTGVLKDSDLAQEMLQATFAKAVALGHTAQRETLKGWLFQVAFREALAHRRTVDRHDRIHRRLVYEREGAESPSETSLLKAELIEQVRGKLDQLPPELRTIVRLKIYEQMTFAEIARQLKIPQGTVVTRMRTALQRLGTHLTDLVD